MYYVTLKIFCAGFDSGLEKIDWKASVQSRCSELPANNTVRLCE
jgi:hypothetical protein